MDEDLRALERSARATPEDLAAGRAFADALLRRGDRRACFAELTRLARMGHLESRADVSRWLPWTGPAGNGDTRYAACRPIEGRPNIEVRALPGTDLWRVVATDASSIVLQTLPPRQWRGQLECMRLDTTKLASWWRTELSSTSRWLGAHGEDLVWLDNHELCVLSIPDGPPHEERALPVRCSSLWGFADGDALVIVDDYGSTSAFLSRDASIPLFGGASGERWSRVARGFPLGPWSGRPLIHTPLDREGVPFHPGAQQNIGREQWNALELLDAATGEVYARSRPVAEQLEVLARDDDALVVRRDRRWVELCQALATPPRVRVDTESVGGEPGPVLTPDELVVVTSTPESSTTMSLELRVIDRSTGVVRWTTAFPLILLPTPLPPGGVFSAPRVTGAIAAAGPVLYAAVEGAHDITVTAYDLASGAERFEVTVPAAADRAAAMFHVFDVPLLQVVPIDGALIVVVATAKGSLIARLG